MKNLRIDFLLNHLREIIFILISMLIEQSLIGMN